MPQLRRLQGLELALPEAERFDPFALYNACDAAPSQLKSIGEQFQKANRELTVAKSKLRQIEANLKTLCSIQIQSTRPQGSTKAPTISEIDNLFQLIVGSENARDVMLQYNHLPEQLIDLFKEYHNVEESVTAWQGIAETAQITLDAWRVRCSMLRSQVALMQSLMQQNLIQVPRDGGVTWTDEDSFKEGEEL